MNEKLEACIKLLESQQCYLSDKIDLIKVLTAQAIGSQVLEQLKKIVDNPAQLNMNVKRIPQNGRK